MKNEPIYLSLLSMGFEQDPSYRAAQKFDDPESAINWVLEGAVDDPTPVTEPPHPHASTQPQPLPHRPSPYQPPTTPHPHSQAHAQAQNHHPRSTTPYPADPPPPPSPPGTPSPTVSDLDGRSGDGTGGGGGTAWKSHGWDSGVGNDQGSFLVQNLQRGLTEDQALAEAIRLSQEEITPSSSSSYSHAQTNVHPTKPTTQIKYNPPSGPPPPPLPSSRPVLQLRPPPPPPPAPPPSAASTGRPRPPPPPPPTSTSTTTAMTTHPADSRQTRSPTPGPPESRSDQGRFSAGEAGGAGGVASGVVGGSKNPFLSAMRSTPGLGVGSDIGSATPTAGPTLNPSENNTDGSGERGQRTVGSDRNVRFGGEDIVPPDLLPPWLRGAGSIGSVPGAGAGPGGMGITEPSQTGSDAQTGGTSLKKVSDEVDDHDGSRGMVLVPSSERVGPDSMAVDGPARSSQVDRRLPTMTGSAGGAYPSPPSPPPMDTYPIDKDEEQLAFERAIKLSLSTTTITTNNTHNPLSRANDENTVEGVVTGAAEYDMVVDEETTRLAMTEVEDWRRDEDDTDFNVVRESGAPLAVRSRTENTVWSAHVVQALISVPAIRRAIDVIDPENLDPVLFGEQIHRDVVDFLKQLVDKHDKRDISETVVTAKLDHFGLRSGPIAIGERAYEMMKLFAPSLDYLPTVPIVPAKETLEPETIDVGMSNEDPAATTESVPEAAIAVKEEGASAMDQDSENVVVAEPPRRLFTSEMRRRDDPTQGQTYDFCWMIPHDPRTDKTISDAISNAQKTWRPDHLFSSLSQVFCLGMTKADQTPGSEALVGLEESLYLDRFMIGNADRVDGLNVRQNELRTSIETRKKEMEDLVKHKGQDIDKMIERTIRYFDETYEMEGSPEATMVVKNATITQLRTVKSKLDEKRAVLSTALEAEETELRGLWDKPELKLNKYNLQAVCFNSGWSGMNAIRSYIKGDGEQWWRVQESVMEKVTFHDLATDNWGMMFDQGPYFLIYTRDGDNDDAEHLGMKVPKVDETVAQPLEKEERGTKDIKPFEEDKVLVDVGASEGGGKANDDLKVYM